MSRWKDLEAAPVGTSLATAEAIDILIFDERGLLPVVAQQHDSGQVLMLAWMNKEALRQTLHTGFATYYSRSRKQLWTKGETSQQRQHVKELRVDCDGDALLLLVHQEGVACHTGRERCFYLRLDQHELRVTDAVRVAPADLYGDRGGTKPT